MSKTFQSAKNSSAKEDKNTCSADEMKAFEGENDHNGDSAHFLQ